MAKDRHPLEYTGRIPARSDRYGEISKNPAGKIKLVAGVATLNSNIIKLKSDIMLVNGPISGSAATGFPFITAQSKGSITITSLDIAGATETLDVSEIYYLIVNPGDE